MAGHQSEQHLRRISFVIELKNWYSSLQMALNCVHIIAVSGFVSDLNAIQQYQTPVIISIVWFLYFLLFVSIFITTFGWSGKKLPNLIHWNNIDVITQESKAYYVWIISFYITIMTMSRFLCLVFSIFL
jgi:hypothetical protein